MFEIGRICVKIAGRDAGKKCVIVDLIDDNHVMIDGETRRRKCNFAHLEPLNDAVKLKKGASHEEVEAAVKDLGFNVRNTKPKEKTVRPVQVRKTKSSDEKKDKTAK